MCQRASPRWGHWCCHCVCAAVPWGEKVVFACVCQPWLRVSGWWGYWLPSPVGRLCFCIRLCFTMRTCGRACAKKHSHSQWTHGQADSVRTHNEVSARENGCACKFFEGNCASREWHLCSRLEFYEYEHFSEAELLWMQKLFNWLSLNLSGQRRRDTALGCCAELKSNDNMTKEEIMLWNYLIVQLNL